MRPLPLLGSALLIAQTLLAASPAFADGALALAGLQEIARSPCAYRDEPVDPQGLAAALDGVIGDVMGLRDSDTIIGMIYDGDPQAGARMWASNLALTHQGCETLVHILSSPVEALIAEVQAAQD
ncbi:hypothetical protein [Gymnodinialimonas hymeniacidonis]|uniref:hypothetical protein n=1 Tax=Gymnodinialimonas hymeniacidonis TaxID=3126508 RepID=UPI0034C5C3B7